MTPLPSVYKGYHCRSRLEARWLCFLDTLGLQFIYEPEGFKFEDGTCYLPDLYFPVIETWGEIKPEIPLPSSPEGKKITLLVEESKKPLIILDGSPALKAYTEVYYSDRFCENKGPINWIDAPYPVSLDIHTFDKYYFGKCDGKPRLFVFPWDMAEEEYSQQYRDAIYASRSLRFDTH